jgi:hypothetical protein
MAFIGLLQKVTDMLVFLLACVLIRYGFNVKVKRYARESKNLRYHELGEA